MDQHRPSFAEEIKFFLNACPGPAVARHGLHIAAFQEVRGIPRLVPTREDDEPREVSKPRRGSGQGEGDRSYLSEVAEVAELIGCRSGYLSEAALRHGYQDSRALRWIRFLHGMALRAEGVSALTLVMRLGFADLAGWNRSTRRLVGRTPRQLPSLPIDYWVRRAVDDLFLSPATTETERQKTNRGEDNLEQ